MADAAPAAAARSCTDCLADRDLRYTSWAAFIDFLVASHGMEKLLQLLGSAEEQPASPDAPAAGIRFLPTISVDVLELIRAGQPQEGRDAQDVAIPRQPAASPVLPLPDFVGVYGLTLDELEEAWLLQLP